MNIAEEKNYCYSMMKDITDERRRLSEMYMSLKTRVDELNRLEEKEKETEKQSTKDFFGQFGEREIHIQINNFNDETNAPMNKANEEIVATAEINKPSEEIVATAEEIISTLEQMTPPPTFEATQAKAVKEFEYKQAEPENVPSSNNYDNGSYTGVKIGADKVRRYQAYYTCDNARCRHKGKRYITPETIFVYCHECASKMKVRPATSQGFPSQDSFKNFFIAGNRITEEEIKSYANPAERIEDVLSKYEGERENFTNIRITKKPDKKEAIQKQMEIPLKEIESAKPEPKPEPQRGRRVESGLSTKDASILVEEILRTHRKPMHREELWKIVVQKSGAHQLSFQNFVNNILLRIIKVNPKVTRAKEKGFYQFKK